jgi:4-hydroxymandelate synthase
MREQSTSPPSQAGPGTPGQPLAFDALELWVGDLDRTGRLLAGTFGFQFVDATVNGGPEARVACLASGDIRIILRQGTAPTSPIARHVAAHGDTVADVALVSTDAAAIAERALVHGLTVRGTADAPTIDLFSDRTVCHTVRAATGVVAGSGSMLDGSRPRSVDHVAYCLPWGAAERTAMVYEEVLGLNRLSADSFDAVGDEVTGMRSIVLRSAAGFTVVLTEPTSRAGTGQTQRFVNAHGGPGVQHVALACDDLPATIESLRRSGAEFLPIPDLYYDRAQQRLSDIPIAWESLRRLEILVDADHNGLLFQLFTRPLTDRRTFFFEFIQRAGATGFGANNIRALFEAVQATMNEDI